MFGKNYDKEIKMLMDGNVDSSKKIVETRNMILELNKDSSNIHDSMIELAKVQATHKECITFLLNHATVDADAKKDFMKLIKNIVKAEEMADKS